MFFAQVLETDKREEKRRLWVYYNMGCVYMCRKERVYYNMGYVYMCKKERERCRGRCDASTLSRSEKRERGEFWKCRDREIVVFERGGREGRWWEMMVDDMWGYYKRPSWRRGRWDYGSVKRGCRWEWFGLFVVVFRWRKLLAIKEMRLYIWRFLLLLFFQCSRYLCYNFLYIKPFFLQFLQSSYDFKDIYPRLN